MILTIGVPTTGLMHARTGLSIAAAVRSLPVNIDIDFQEEFGCYVALNRERLAEKALAIQSDYLCFVDTDMVFQPDSIYRLLAQRVEIVGAQYNRRDFPTRPVEIGLDGQPLKEKPSELTPVKAVGGGLLLIKTDVFRTLPRPWFKADWTPNGYKGEDVYFCEQAGAHGYTVWCDPTINIRHIGEHQF